MSYEYILDKCGTAFPDVTSVSGEDRLQQVVGDSLVLRHQAPRVAPLALVRCPQEPIRPARLLWVGGLVLRGH
jgi:hypothetical protein